MITFIKLNAIDFKKWNSLKLAAMKENAQSHVSDEYTAYIQILEKNFDIISREAWVTLIMQIFKVFLIERINLRQIKSIMDETSDSNNTDIFNGSSNSRIYSNSEILLMKWVSFNHNKVCTM